MKSQVRYHSILLIKIFLITVINITSVIHLLALNQRKLLTSEPLLENPIKINSLQEKAFNHLVASVYSGDSLFISGDLVEAERAYIEGLLVLKNMDMPWCKILLLNRVGFTSYWLTDIDQSLDYYNQSLILIRNQNVILDSLAYLEAFVFFRMNSRYNKKYQTNMELDEEVITTISDDVFINPTRKFKYHILKAHMLSIENRYDEVDQQIQKADYLYRNINNMSKFWSFYFRFTQGRYFKLVRDYNLAVRYFSELEHKVEQEKELEKFKYFIYVNLLETNSYLLRYKIAAEYIEKLQSYSHEIMHPFFYYNYILIGQVYKELGQFEKTLMYFRKAENIILRYGVEDENLVYVYFYIAMYYKEVEHDQEMMLKYLRLAENIINRYCDPYLESYIVCELGKYYYYKKEYDLAIIIFNLVLDDVEQLTSDEKYFKSQHLYLSRSHYLSILDINAAAFYYLSEQKNFDMISLTHSYENYKQLVSLNEKMFKEQGIEESKIASLKKVRKAFENLFEVGYTLYKQTKDNSYLIELFSYSERSKAYMLKNYVSDELAKRIGGVPENLINDAREIKEEIDSMQYSFSQGGPQNYGSSDELLVNRILLKQEEYDIYIKGLEIQYPGYALIKNQENTISIDNIKEILKPDQALLEYFFIYNSFYVFYIDKDTMCLSNQIIESNFPQQLRNYRKLFDNVTFNEFDEEDIMNFIIHSYSIYSRAIKPFEHLISGKRLIIVPDEELSLIPFETLIVKPPDSLTHTAYRNLPYLIMNNPISYIYSASQLNTRGRTRLRGIDYAGFAPDYSNTDMDMNNGSFIPLQSLPGAKNEILSAKKYFRGRIYTDGDVSKARYFKECQRRKIIHLAMHAVLDSIEPMNSWFLFSSQKSNGEGQLHAYEIYAKKIVSSLVLLSACNTGMGKVNRGEGVFSIARAYLLAGVKNVIYTQWSIADRSSAQLMDRFYYYLSQGIPTDVALQKAKVDFILKGDPVKAFPFYWAAYVMTGYPIEVHSQRRIYLGLGISIFVILMALLIWRNH